jgi:hypothetical protein
LGFWGRAAISTGNYGLLGLLSIFGTLRIHFIENEIGFMTYAIP